MKSDFFEQKRLIAEFLANIGVAWFAAGVIGIFVNKTSLLDEAMRSLSWGLGFSSLFLFAGTVIIKGKFNKKWKHKA